MLTQPGLGAIASAVVGAREIFQRMATYAKYTVAMTFRICFTFGLLTVIYNWCGRPPGAWHAPMAEHPLAWAQSGRLGRGPCTSCSAVACITL